MRIIAGIYRSRRLEAPPGFSTRPTSDRLRETLFNVLAPHLQGAAFLDLYAGSGAVGLEALSRGARRVTFVERAPAALRTLRKNLEILKVGQSCAVQAESVAAFLRSNAKTGAKLVRHEVVFLDPPYDAEEEYATTLGRLGLAQGILAEGALVIAEHRRKQRLEERYGRLLRTRLLEQGDAALSFYAVESKTGDEAGSAPQSGCGVCDTVKTRLVVWL